MARKNLDRLKQVPTYMLLSSEAHMIMRQRISSMSLKGHAVTIGQLITNLLLDSATEYERQQAQRAITETMLEKAQAEESAKQQ